MIYYETTGLGKGPIVMVFHYDAGSFQINFFLGVGGLGEENIFFFFW